MYADSIVNGEVFSLTSQFEEMYAERNEIRPEMYRIRNSRVFHFRDSNRSKFSNFWRKNLISQFVQFTVF